MKHYYRLLHAIRGRHTLTIYFPGYYEKGGYCSDCQDWWFVKQEDGPGSTTQEWTFQ